jgi:hypothetical protein
MGRVGWAADRQQRGHHAHDRRARARDPRVPECRGAQRHRRGPARSLRSRTRAPRARGRGTGGSRADPGQTRRGPRAREPRAGPGARRASARGHAPPARRRDAAAGRPGALARATGHLPAGEDAGCLTPAGAGAASRGRHGKSAAPAVRPQHDRAPAIGAASAPGASAATIRRRPDSDAAARSGQALAEAEGCGSSAVGEGRRAPRAALACTAGGTRAIPAEHRAATRGAGTRSAGATSAAAGLAGARSPGRAGEPSLPRAIAGSRWPWRAALGPGAQRTARGADASPAARRPAEMTAGPRWRAER